MKTQIVQFLRRTVRRIRSLTGRILALCILLAVSVLFWPIAALLLLYFGFTQFNRGDGLTGDDVRNEAARNRARADDDDIPF